MKKIYLLTDYLDKFGSKHNSSIYKNGMDKDLLSKNFLAYGFETEFLSVSKVDFRKHNWKGKVVLYSSQEDVGYYYKSFIEDIIYGLEIVGAKLIPSFKYMRAHSNKVFMEVLRDLSPNLDTRNIKANYYGCLEEALQDESRFNYPVVLKSAEGAMSKNVALANNKSKFLRVIKKLAATHNLKEEVREAIRSFKYKGYQKQSKYRKKIIIQNFIPGLSHDWKILVFGDKYFIVERQVRKNDFRASGAGNNTFGSQVRVPPGIFTFSKKIINQLNVPMVSLDIVMANNKFYLLEFQALYFGTSGHWKSDCYYQQDGEKFIKKENNLSLEEIYVDSIVHYLK